MSERNLQILSFRENLNLSIDKTEKSSLINFQNSVIRPILKFQNNIIVAIFNDYIKNKKFSWATSDSPMKKKFIYASLTNDKHLKVLYIGLNLALFTIEELDFYFSNQKEFNKRITAMIKERLIDQMFQDDN
jgi:hypothetical protein